MLTRLVSGNRIQAQGSELLQLKLSKLTKF